MYFRKSLLALSLTSIMASTAFAGDIKPLHGGFTGSLGSTATATDIIRFKCGTQAGINQAVAKVKDTGTTGAKPVVQVQVAPWNGSTCNTGVFNTAKPDGTTATGDADATFSALTGAVSAVSGGTYCAKVSKTPGHQNNQSLPDSAAFSETYELDHHCEQAGNPTHPASTLIQYDTNQ